MEASRRHPNHGEVRLLRALIERAPAYQKFSQSLDTMWVVDMYDGGMGSFTFLSEFDGLRSALQVAEVTFHDLDGMWVSATLNVDQFDELFELDIFKGDNSPLLGIPETFE